MGVIVQVLVKSRLMVLCKNKKRQTIEKTEKHGEVNLLNIARCK